MSAVPIDPIGEVLSRVSDWPSREGLVLVQQILQTLPRDLGARPPERNERQNLLGLLQAECPPPSEEECERLLEEELLRKYGT